MGFGDFFKKVGEATKKAMDKAAKEARYRAKALEIKREIAEAERRFKEEVTRKEFEAKREILSQLKMRQLEAVCAAKGIPTYRTQIVNGEERRYKIRNKDELIDVVASHLTVEEVAEVAKRYKVKSRHVVQHFTKWLEEANEALKAFKEQKQKELEEYKAQLFGEESHEIASIELESETVESLGGEELGGYSLEEDNHQPELDVVDILFDFEPETVRDEEDLEKQLYQYLRARLGRRVVRQYPVGDQKIDIAIDGNVGIELKIAESRSKLQRLVGQVLDYVEYFDEVIAVILDVGANVDIDKYIKKLRRLGAKVIVLEGDIKRKGPSKEIIIKDSRRKIIIR
ncbi:hypothetical protein A3L14_11030 [Thermococcus thioreducens]|uniref:Uncharacterized protein n=2 Tax=Thermococcaceae TaxID=2259 RepID=A0A0Q2RGP1_9EURY|nr:hypothetical protein A3L14_11030 [Thermococcus thioreducens]KQH83214.1 hypothetical protein AMR53_00585 [Thermococcus thioreducens]SEW23533.1 hypothetical protein SAMN05216170_2314 [Thermococcus thioreducens]